MGPDQSDEDTPPGGMEVPSLDLMTLDDEGIAALVNVGYLKALSFWDFQRMMTTKLQVLSSQYSETVSEYNQVLSFEQDPDRYVSYYGSPDGSTFYIVKPRGRTGFIKDG